MPVWSEVVIGLDLDDRRETLFPGAIDTPYMMASDPVGNGDFVSAPATRSAVYRLGHKIP